MARIKQTKKPKDVAKFGGTENLGKVTFDGNTHEAATIEALSKTRLEDDPGEGGVAIIRRFKFGLNLAAFKEHPPTHQELFNSHVKGIEMALWRDGLKVIPEVKPRLVVDDTNGFYEIFVGAKPERGHILHERPVTLAQIAKGEAWGTE